MSNLSSLPRLSLQPTEKGGMNRFVEMLNPHLCLYTLTSLKYDYNSLLTVEQSRHPV